MFRRSPPPRLTGTVAPNSVQNWLSDPSAGSTSREELQALTLTKMEKQKVKAAIFLTKVHDRTG